MNAREALEVVARAVGPEIMGGSPKQVVDVVEAAAVLRELVDVADLIWASEVGPWRSALGAALDGRSGTR